MPHAMRSPMWFVAVATPIMCWLAAELLWRRCMAFVYMGYRTDERAGPAGRRRGPAGHGCGGEVTLRADRGRTRQLERHPRRAVCVDGPVRQVRHSDNAVRILDYYLWRSTMHQCATEHFRPVAEQAKNGVVSGSPSVDSLAESLSLSPGTVKSCRHRGIARLRQRLSG